MKRHKVHQHQLLKPLAHQLLPHTLHLHPQHETPPPQAAKAKTTGLDPLLTKWYETDGKLRDVIPNHQFVIEESTRTGRTLTQQDLPTASTRLRQIVDVESDTPPRDNTTIPKQDPPIKSYIDIEDVQYKDGHILLPETNRPPSQAPIQTDESPLLDRGANVDSFWIQSLSILINEGTPYHYYTPDGHIISAQDYQRVIDAAAVQRRKSMKTHVDSVAFKPGYMDPPFQDVKKPEPTKTRLKQQADLARTLPRTAQDPPTGPPGKQPSSPEPQPPVQAPVSAACTSSCTESYPCTCSAFRTAHTSCTYAWSFYYTRFVHVCHPKLSKLSSLLPTVERVAPTTPAAASSPDTIVPAQPVTQTLIQVPTPSGTLQVTLPSGSALAPIRDSHGDDREAEEDTDTITDSACGYHYATFPGSLQYTPRYTFYADEPGYLQYYCYTRFCRHISF